MGTMIRKLFARSGLRTYFLPMQSLGPTENGWKMSLESSSKRLSPSHRSGIKCSGWRKWAGSWYIAHCQVSTKVCTRLMVSRCDVRFGDKTYSLCNVIVHYHVPSLCYYSRLSSSGRRTKPHSFIQHSQHVG